MLDGTESETVQGPDFLADETSDPHQSCASCGSLVHARPPKIVLWNTPAHRGGTTL